MSTFGEEFEQIWPKAGDVLNFTDFGKNLLRKCKDIKKPDIEQSCVDIEAFKMKSSNFPLEFGVNTCRVISQPKERYPFIEKQIASAYPLIHERVLKLYLDFLEYKCQYGNNIEKEIYTNITLNEFIQRLLMRRCISFFGKNDKYLLITRQHGCGGFIEVGTLQEKPPLLLKNVLSYDEMKTLPEHENMLLIVSYAWDGNALPGNEFWMKMLKSTGDSAAACSTLITELHNPHINSLYVNGNNLHVASERYGILHVADYIQKILN